MSGAYLCFANIISSGMLLWRAVRVQYKAYSHPSNFHLTSAVRCCSWVIRTSGREVTQTRLSSTFRYSASPIGKLVPKPKHKRLLGGGPFPLSSLDPLWILLVIDLSYLQRWVTSSRTVGLPHPNHSIIYFWFSCCSPFLFLF